MLGADLREVQRATEITGGDAVPVEPPVQFAEHGMEQIVRIEAVALREAGEEIERGLRAGPVGESDGTVERDEERGEADGLVAEFLAQEAVAGGGLVALVEEEIGRGKDAVEARREVRALG